MILPVPLVLVTPANLPFHAGRRAAAPRLLFCPRQTFWRCFELPRPDLEGDPLIRQSTWQLLDVGLTFPPSSSSPADILMRSIEMQVAPAAMLMLTQCCCRLPAIIVTWNIELNGGDQPANSVVGSAGNGFETWTVKTEQGGFIYQSADGYDGVKICYAH